MAYFENMVMTFQILLNSLANKAEKNALITFIRELKLIEGEIKPNPWDSDVLETLKGDIEQLAKIQRFKKEQEELIKQKLGEDPNLSPEEETLLRKITQKVVDKKYGEQPQFQITQVDVKNFKGLVNKLIAFLRTHTPQENLIQQLNLTQTHVPVHGGMLQSDQVSAIFSVFQQFENRLNFESNWKALTTKLGGHPSAAKIETSEAAGATAEARQSPSQSSAQDTPQILTPVNPDDNLEVKKEAVCKYLKLLAAKLKERNIQVENAARLAVQKDLPPYEQKLIARYNAMLDLHDMITQSIKESAPLDENQATDLLSTCVSNKPDWDERDLLKKVLDCFSLGLTALWRHFMSRESAHQGEIEALVSPSKKP